VPRTEPAAYFPGSGHGQALELDAGAKRQGPPVPQALRAGKRGGKRLRRAWAKSEARDPWEEARRAIDRREST